MQAEDGVDFRVREAALFDHELRPTFLADGWTIVFDETITLSEAGELVLPFAKPFIHEGKGNVILDFLITDIESPAPWGVATAAPLFTGDKAHRTLSQSGSALIDYADDFDPGSWPADDLRCLVWLRCRNVQDALPLADLFARDANLQLVFLDLRHAAARDLRRIPATTWYRLQRALEQTDASLLVFTPTAAVPSAQLRLTLERSFDFPALSAPRPALTAALPISVQRQRLAPHSAVG